MMTPGPIRRIQIYGERCSGTNWVHEILRRNLRGVRMVDDYGWKHGWLQGDIEHADDCLFVVVHRDPFDWLRSLHQMPWHTAPELRDVPFARFVRTPWRCLWGSDMELAGDDPRLGTEMLHERDPITQQPFANAMRLRTAKIRAWDALQTRSRHHLFVRYETVLADARAFLRDTAVRFGLRRRLWFRQIATYKGGRERFAQRPRVALAAEDLAWIRNELDVPLETAHGFDVLARMRELGGDGAPE